MTVLGSGQETALPASHLSKLLSFLRGGRSAGSSARTSASGRRYLELRDPLKRASPPVSALPRTSLVADGETQRAAAPEDREMPLSYGLSESLLEHFHLGRPLGEGGNAIVVRAVSRHTGKEYACKCIRKEKARPTSLSMAMAAPQESLYRLVLIDPKASDLKRADHRHAIQHELDAVRKLQGALNVAAFEEAYEDRDNVYIVTELCRGGELWHRIGEKHYSERTVASYMRAVLRTLAQCHSHHILHRDIKPGNFMLLNEDDRSPLKAIDFGLAVSYDPDRLPRSDLGLEGTPWFMAPEVLRSAVEPASDIWSAGVMAHQLLTGRFPFDDKRNPGNPSISKIWQSIFCDEVDFKRKSWDGITAEAKDFVALLLNKDPKKRPTAKQALQHSWLRGGPEERSTGKALSLKVVQRIQRYAQSSQFKRTVLEFMAAEMLESRVDAPPGVCRITAGATPVVTSPTDSSMEYLYAQLGLAEADVADRHEISNGLQRLGYKLERGEAERLLDQVDVGHTGHVAKGQLAASQIDWGALQRDRERWLARVKRAFDEFDADHDGVCGWDEIVACLRAKLPLTEVAAAVRHAMQEAGKSEESMKAGLSFEQFVAMLRADSRDSLDQYDDRMGASHHGSYSGSMHGGSLHGGSLHGGSSPGLPALLDRSMHAGESFQPRKPLDPVAEAA